MPILEKDNVVLDYLETGQGTTVILIHSTVSGNRQWKTLMEDLGRDFRVLAPNLRGYGKTSSWLGERTLNLSDQVQLIESLIEFSEQKVYLALDQHHNLNHSLNKCLYHSSTDGHRILQLRQLSDESSPSQSW